MDQTPPTHDRADDPPAESRDDAAPAACAPPAGAVARPAGPKRQEPAPDETVKETIESIVIAFILAFVFRAFVVEPFIIPTGSMAPTMLGAHLQMDCPSCGYHFDTGIDQEEAAEGASLKTPKSSACPMCNYLVIAQPGTRVRSGDRILVDKFSYHFVDPSRWDVIVFKAPLAQLRGGEPGPRTNFIKRLIGLPGERICLLDGNVYVAPAGTNDFVIARKTDPEANRHWQDIQRTAWQPIYHSQFVPVQDAGPDGPGRDERHAWRVPWSAEHGAWDLGTPRRPSRVYRFAGGEGVIRFEMDGPYGTTQYDDSDTKLPYNAFTPTSDRVRNPIEDIRLACGFRPTTDQAMLQLSTTARLDRPGNGVETLIARVTTGGEVSLAAIADGQAERALGQPARIDPLTPGVSVDVELWLVDDEASVWVNGDRLVVYRFDLTWEQVAARPRQRATPDPKISIVSDGPVELRRVELDRDLYYYPKLATASGFSRAQAKRVEGRLELGPDPLDLRVRGDGHDAELLALGDNQAGSDDGRAWNNVDGWVQQRYFDGSFRPGVIPRSLLVGRAFMVYYPAPHGSSPQTKGVFPDFGRMRFVH